MKRRVLGLILLSILVVGSVGGCGKKATVSSVLEGVKASSSKSTSSDISAIFDIDLDLKAEKEGTTVSISADGSLNSKVYNNISEVSGDLNINILGMTQNAKVLTYTTTESDKSIVYTYDSESDSWSKSEVETEKNPVALISSIDYSKYKDKFTLSDKTEKINDINCYKLTGTITGADLKSDLPEMSTDSAITSLVSSTDFDSAVNGLSINTTVYVDSKTLSPVSVVLDLSKSDFASLGNSIGKLFGMTMTTNITNAKVTLNVNSLNKAEVLVVPDAALNSRAK